MTEAKVDLRGVASSWIGYDGLASLGPRDRAVDAAVGAFESLGAELVPIELPAYDAMTAAAHVILHVEAFAVHRATLMARWDEYGRNTLEGQSRCVDPRDRLH